MMALFAEIKNNGNLSTEILEKFKDLKICNEKQSKIWLPIRERAKTKKLVEQKPKP